MYHDYLRAALFFDIIVLFFLLLVYVRKIRNNVKKKKFLFGLLFMSVIFLIKVTVSIFTLDSLGDDAVLNLLYLTILEVVAFSGLLFGELSDLKRYLKEYKK